MKDFKNEIKNNFPCFYTNSILNFMLGVHGKISHGQDYIIMPVFSQNCLTSILLISSIVC